MQKIHKDLPLGKKLSCREKCKKKTPLWKQCVLRQFYGKSDFQKHGKLCDGEKYRIKEARMSTENLTLVG